MKPVVIIYLAVGIASLFLGNITNDLLALGIREEIVSIIGKALSAAVIGVGAVAVQQGVTLPTIPPKDE